MAKTSKQLDCISLRNQPSPLLKSSLTSLWSRSISLCIRAQGRSLSSLLYISRCCPKESSTSSSDILLSLTSTLPLKPSLLLCKPWILKSLPPSPNNSSKCWLIFHFKAKPLPLLFPVSDLASHSQVLFSFRWNPCLISLSSSSKLNLMSTEWRSSDRSEYSKSKLLKQKTSHEKYSTKAESSCQNFLLSGDALSNPQCSSW